MSQPIDLPQDVLDAAEREAQRRGWIWLLPVEGKLVQSSGERLWALRTNAHAVGSTILVKIRESDLAILEAKFLPR